jgi:NIPSNAP protein
MMRRLTFAGSAGLIAACLGLVIVAAQAQRGQPPAAAPAAPAAQAGRGAPPAAPTPPCGPNLPADVKNVAKDSRCFELRTYTVREGSSIDLLHTRFRERTTALFKKHGMTNIGYWQPVSKPNTLIYILAYKDGTARDAAWAAFQADPDWVKTRTEMQVAVQVDNVFMSATDYSPVK